LKDPARFIETHAAWTPLPFLEGIGAYLASEVTPLWEATEIWLEETGLAPPYWAFAWPGGQALARYVLDRPEEVRGRRVLDFAAGAGLAGIAACRAGAARAQGSDLDPLALSAMALNAQRNHEDFTPLDEDVTRHPPASGHAPWDVVLAGDVCYEKPMTDLVLPWLRAMAGRGARVLLADPGRAYLPVQGLVELARYKVPVSQAVEASEMRETLVYALMP
jgi:predicted nicotinamide N-methyase